MSTSETASAATSRGQGICDRRAEHDGDENDRCVACDRPFLDPLNEVHEICLLAGWAVTR